jgi:GNAT superfamily N-acetyltransferase
MESGQAVSLKVRVVPASHMATVAGEFESECGEVGSQKIDYLQAFEGERSVGLLGLEWSAGGNVWLCGPKIELQGPKAAQVARVLLAAANQQIEQRHVTLAQVMLNPAQQIESGWYTDFGYDRVITLELNVRRISSEETAHEFSPPQSDCHSILYAPEHHVRFSKTLAASYVGSQDCLVLRGQSEPEAALADYRGRGLFEPTLWRLFQSADEDFGCLLLRHHADDASLEIVYLGLIPAFRRLGWGHWATCIAMAEAKRLGCRQLTVAVDTGNAAALRLYAHCGFWCFSKKRVQIRTFDSQAIDP